MTSKLHFDPHVIAHRGASGYAPENTMAAFVKAVQLGARWIEFDVMLSSDQKTIVFHDDDLNRTTNGHGWVGDYSYHQLRALDAGKWFGLPFSSERIPSLMQVLEFIDNTNIQANVEIKPLAGQDKATAQRVWQAVQAYKPALASSLLFSSFSLSSLEEMRKIAPECQLALLMHQWLPDWQSICDKLNCISVHMNQEIVTPENSKKVKNTQRSLLCYTVNDPFRANELFSFGVDAVFSDFPDKIAQIK